MKRVFAAVVLVGLLVPFAFASGSSESSASAGNSGAKTTIRIVWWGSKDRHDRTLEVLDMYTKQHPNLKFEPEFTSWSGYWEKVSAEAAAKNLPDIMQQDYQYIQQWNDKGLLLDMNSLVNANKIDLSNVDKGILDSGTLNGKLIGIPMGVNANDFIYDPALLKKAGVPEPTPDWTWADFVQDALQIHQKLGIFAATALPAGAMRLFWIYLRQNGETLFSPDNTKLGYSDDNLFVKFFSLEKKLSDAKALPLPGQRMEVKSIEDDFVITQRAAFGKAGWSNHIVAMEKVANRPLEMALVPNLQGQKQFGLYLKPALFISIAQQTKYPEIAAGVVDYFTNSIPANKVLLAERGVPISSAVRSGIRPLMSDAQKKMFDYIELVKTHSSKIDPPDPPGSGEVSAALDNIESEMMYNKITIEQGATEFRHEANAVLGKNAP